MGVVTLGELMDLVEEILDEDPDAADYPIRVRGMYVTDLYAEQVEERGVLELVALPEGEVDFSGESD